MMKRIILSLFVASLFLSCGSLSTKLSNQQIADVDLSNCAIVTYSGSSSTLKVSLYKINGIPRQKYLDKTLFWSYSQTGSLGFSFSTPVGENNFEFIDFTAKKIVIVNCNLANAEYEFDFKKGCLLYEIRDNKKVSVPITINDVRPNIPADEKECGTLYIDKMKENQILLFRINKKAPPELNHKIGNNYVFNDYSNEFSMDLPVGDNELEIGISGVSSGLSGQKYFVVHIVHVNVEKGMKYKISLETTKIDNVLVIKPVVSKI